MAFKKNNRDPYEQWRKANQHALIQAGLPMDVVSDRDRFWFFVQEGGGHLGGADPYLASWDVGFLSNEQAREILTLLQKAPGDSGQGDLMMYLRLKLGMSAFEESSKGEEKRGED